MLRPGKAQSARQSIVLPQTFDSRLGQHEIFEIDRSNLVRQIRTIQREISESAEEMEMVAIEQVFVKPVSQALTRTARKLYRVAVDLSGLERLIERAQLPRPPERSNSKPTPHNRLKGRD